MATVSVATAVDAAVSGDGAAAGGGSVAMATPGVEKLLISSLRIHDQKVENNRANYEQHHATCVAVATSVNGTDSSESPLRAGGQNKSAEQSHQALPLSSTSNDTGKLVAMDADQVARDDVCAGGALSVCESQGHPVAKDATSTTMVAKNATSATTVAKDATSTTTVAKDAKSAASTAVVKSARQKRRENAAAAAAVALSNATAEAAITAGPVAMATEEEPADDAESGVPLELYLEADESGALALQSKAALLLAFYPAPLPCRVHLVQPPQVEAGTDEAETEEQLGSRASLVRRSPRGHGPGTELPALARPTVLYAGLPSVARALAELGGPAGRALLGRQGVCLKACKERSRWTRLCEVTCPGQLGAWALGGPPPACLEDLELALLRPRYKPRPHLEGKLPTLSDVLIACYLRDAAGRSSRAADTTAPLPLGPRTADLLARMCADPAFAAAAAVGDRFDTLHRAGADDAPRLTDKRAQIPSLCTESLRQLLDSLELAAVSLPWQPESEAPPLPPLPAWLAEEVPPERAARKRQQLASLAAAVLPLARPGHVIVDFCSGSGYLGLLLAHLLPRCQVVLVENKLESLQFALGRLRSLHLPNVRLVQANLCSFQAPFDIGAALHACGSASDLVLDACARAGAACVLSPCCHGATKPGPGLAYPRSAAAAAAGLSAVGHAQLCHAADRCTGRQSRQLLARRALRMVDSDRALAMLERRASGGGGGDGGYGKAWLALMRPADCSPKNSILVAVPA